MPADAYDVLLDEMDRPKWLELRKGYVGASDSAMLFSEGFSNVLQLWGEKTERIVREDAETDEDERTHWGRVLEASIIRAYSSERYAGREAKGADALVVSRVHVWMSASLDAWTYHPEHGWVPLEVKTAAVDQAHLWRDGVPEKYRIQCNHQMIVTGTRAASIACLVGGNRLVWYDVEREDALCEDIIARTERFYRCMQSDREPEVIPGPGLGETVSQLYPRDDGESIALPDAYEDVVAILEDAKAREKAAKAEREVCEAKLKLAIGGARRGVLPSGRTVTWSTHTRETKAREASVSEYRRFTISRGAA